MKLTPEAQMRSNARAWLREAGFPPTRVLDDPPARQDHCFLECAPGAVEYARSIMDPWKLGINSPDHQPFGYPSVVEGWRERRARWAAQVNLHRTKEGREVLELDFDASNPNWGLALAIGHALFDWTLQKVRKTKTNPFTVAQRRGWTVEEA